MLNINVYIACHIDRDNKYECNIFLTLLAPIDIDFINTHNIIEWWASNP